MIFNLSIYFSRGQVVFFFFVCCFVCMCRQFSFMHLFKVVISVNHFVYTYVLFFVSSSDLYVIVYGEDFYK